MRIDSTPVDWLVFIRQHDMHCQHCSQRPGSLRCEAKGAFLVSAKRRAGQTEWVRIKSLAGERCWIRPAMQGKLHVAGDRAYRVTEIRPGLVELDLRAGEEAWLWNERSL